MRYPNEMSRTRVTLKRILIENYRSCLRTSLDLHENLSVLIGPNSSGKTNILQAIMLLNKIAREYTHRNFSEEAGSFASRLRADFVAGSTQVRLNTSLNAHTDQSNSDILMRSEQKWTLKARNGDRASTQLPMQVIAGTAPSYYYGPVLQRRSVRGKFYVYRTAMETPKWVQRDIANIGRYCDGFRYYGASQFTNPGACPASIEIEQEGNQRRLLRLRGHARILYDMYSAHKSKSKDLFREFIDIVGPKGLRLIDDLTFKVVPTSSVEYSVRRWEDRAPKSSQIPDNPAVSNWQAKTLAESTL